MDVPIHSLSSLKQDYNYMCFRAFYTSIYNIHLGFIKIERKKTEKRQEQSLPKKRGRLSEESLSLGGVYNGKKKGLGFA